MLKPRTTKSRYFIPKTDTLPCLWHLDKPHPLRPEIGGNGEIAPGIGAITEPSFRTPPNLHPSRVLALFAYRDDAVEPEAPRRASVIAAIGRDGPVPTEVRLQSPLRHFMGLC